MRSGDPMIQLILRTKIHFNLSVSVDINYRNFETIALGTCLCTNYLPELEELGFKDGLNCIMYKNYDECMHKIKEYLMTGMYEKIALEGLKLSAEHTYCKRVEGILKLIASDQKTNR